MNKLQTIELLQQQLPGFYSVEQVIKMINDIEEDAELEFNDELINSIVDEIVDGEMDLIEDYELGMNYHEVEISSVTINSSWVKQAIKSVLGK
jgi:hypothetical protein